MEELSLSMAFEQCGQEPKLTFGVALRRLLRLKLIEVEEGTDWRGDSQRNLRLSGSGESWIESNEGRAASLLKLLVPPPAVPVDDEIPF